MSNTRTPPPTPGSHGAIAALRPWLLRAVDRAEPAVELVIRLCGWSATLFVLAIFFFVFREAAPMLFGKLNLLEFFGSVNWRPSSEIRAAVRHPGAFGGVGFGDGPGDGHRGSAGTGRRGLHFRVLLGPRRGYAEDASSRSWRPFPRSSGALSSYMVLGPLIVALTGAPVGVNLLNGGVVLALMSVPIIVSVGEDALKAVPDSYREAALSLGASRWEMVYRVLFPGGEERAFGGRAAWAWAARSAKPWPCRWPPATPWRSPIACWTRSVR